MFQRSRGRKAVVSIPKRKWRRSRPNHKEWDSTLTDLSVHRASEEEVQRRRLIHRSKNASAARRALGERAKRLFMDPTSPSQVEMEMKKLAILKEVLYDHDDLNEVLKRVDNTMSSVNTMFHGAPFRTSGNLNVTLAPGAKASTVKGQIPLPQETVTQMSLLSDSIMDKHALNDESSSSEDDVDEEKFESKVDYDRFLSVLRDSLNKSSNPARNLVTDDIVATPVNRRTPLNQALNRTEEVKRTMAHVDPTGMNDEEEKVPLKKIDETITNLVEKGDKKKNHTVSFASETDGNITVPPRANITAANMTYENLQEAMESVASNLSELESRRGNEGVSHSVANSMKGDGLAGFTATLIDAVTRLTVYVNEAEGKLLVVESKLSQMKDQNDHQRALLDALTAELMSTQEQISEIKTKASAETERMEKEHQEFKRVIHLEIDELKKTVAEMQKRKTNMVEDNPNHAADLENDIESLVIAQDPRTKEKEEREEALKADMLSLLGALKAQKPKDKSDVAIQSSTAALPMNNATTRGAAQTVASVESQLRHLQLQHTEAQNRLEELTHVAGVLAGNVAESKSSSITESTASPSSINSTIPVISSGPLYLPHNGYPSVIPNKCDSNDSVSTMTITSSMFPNIDDTSRPSIQSNVIQQQKPPSLTSDRRVVDDWSSLKSSDRVYMSEDSFCELVPQKIPTLLQESNFFGIPHDSETDSLKILEKSMSQAVAALPPFKPTLVSVPSQSGETRDLATSMRETQFNLEDRIAELNKQHAKAQERLQNLLKKRTSSVSPTSFSSGSSGSSKLIQVTVPTEDMLKTPQIHEPQESLQLKTVEGGSLL